MSKKLSWYEKLTPEEQAQWRKDCRARALAKNAQQGKPHSNPGALSRAGRERWEQQSPTEQEQWRKDCRERSLEKNAQRGKPHSNPEAVRASTLAYWGSLSLEEKVAHAKQCGTRKHPYGSGKEAPYQETWNLIRNVVLKRDDNTCQDCLQRGNRKNNRLEVHHACFDRGCRLPEHCIVVCETDHRRRHKERKAFAMNKIADVIPYSE